MPARKGPPDLKGYECVLSPTEDKDGVGECAAHCTQRYKDNMLFLVFVSTYWMGSFFILIDFLFTIIK